MRQRQPIIGQRLLDVLFHPGVRALAVETHEEWLESPRYLNMADLRKHNKQQMRAAA